MPTTSPAMIDSGSRVSRVSSTMRGSPQAVPVAAASTYSQRGVMTATPNDTLLGLIRCTRGPKGTSIVYPLEGAAIQRTSSSHGRHPRAVRGPVLESGVMSIDEVGRGKARDVPVPVYYLERSGGVTWPVDPPD